jgi:predicted PolB exonuclease-like 3'-5' exonuclease
LHVIKTFPFSIRCKNGLTGGIEKLGLEHVALALGNPTPKGEGIDGSEVWNFFKAGKVKEICDYCERDVETTRAVYKRMTFDNEFTILTSP